MPPCAWSQLPPLGPPACFHSSDLLPPGTSSLCCSSVPLPPGRLPKLPRWNSLSAVHTLCKRLVPLFTLEETQFWTLSPSPPCPSAEWALLETAYSFLGPMNPGWGHVTTKAGGEACAKLLCEPPARAACSEKEAHGAFWSPAGRVGNWPSGFRGRNSGLHRAVKGGHSQPLWARKTATPQGAFPVPGSPFCDCPKREKTGLRVRPAERQCMEPPGSSRRSQLCSGRTLQGVDPGSPSGTQESCPAFRIQ